MTKTEQWARHLEAQVKSGKSIAEWCREQGLSEKSFSCHRRKLTCGTDSERRTFVQLAGAVEHFEISFGEGLAVKIPVSHGLERAT